jgi:DedD protein
MNGQTMDAMDDEQRGTEFTLGAGKLLGLFFGLVVLCAVFFGVGFSLGKSSISATATDLIPSLTSATGAKPAAASAGMTAQATQLASEPAPAAVDPSSQPVVEPVSAQTAQVESNSEIHGSDGRLAEQARTIPVPSSPAITVASSKRAPEMTRAAATPTSAANLVVQVAAVRKKEDAVALAAALKRKQYAAFVVTNPAVDTLFHVQIGPFIDSKDAEAITARLVKDGYSPIVKR